MLHAACTPQDYERSQLFIPDYVKRNVTGSTNPAHAYASRVEGRQILLDNPARESKAKMAREEQRAKRVSERARKAAGVISKKEGQQKGLWRLRKEETKYGSPDFQRCYYMLTEFKIPTVLTAAFPLARLHVGTAFFVCTTCDNPSNPCCGNAQCRWDALKTPQGRLSWSCPYRYVPYTPTPSFSVVSSLAVFGGRADFL